MDFCVTLWRVRHCHREQLARVEGWSVCMCMCPNCWCHIKCESFTKQQCRVLLELLIALYVKMFSILVNLLFVVIHSFLRGSCLSVNNSRRCSDTHWRSYHGAVVSRTSQVTAAVTFPVHARLRHQYGRIVGSRTSFRCGLSILIAFLV